MSNLVNHSVTNLINGVSQQPTSVRLDNQLEEQINAFSDITKGLTIRNGLEIKNKVAVDISSRYNFEFNIDGVRYLMALDTAEATQLVHVPLTADVTALTASITSSDYFDGVVAGDLKVVENKDKVYILNRNQKVGVSTLKSTFYDINIRNQTTQLNDANWSSGDYTLTITSVVDPDTGFVSVEAPAVFTIDSTMTVQDIVADINASSIINEVGLCEGIGDRGQYRLFFEDIPLDFYAPTIVIAETTAIENTVYTTINEPASGFTASADYYVSEVRTAYGYDYIVRYAAVDVFTVSSTTKLSSFVSGIYTYFSGNVTSTTGSGIGTTVIKQVRRESVVTSVDSYDDFISQPSIVTGAEFSADKFADEGMIWVTGVASNQTYDVTISYEDAAGTPQADLVLTTISVGTTVGNIKLNWVADQIRSQIDASTHFSSAAADLYSNALRFYSTTGYAYKVTGIKVDNNFDQSSISAAIKAAEDNTSGVTDISDLPPTFSDGFKVRVGDISVVGSNYYLKYDAEFEGWKESGLDESRSIDTLTMPYVIDKEKVRRDGVIVLEPTEWADSRAGDQLSNKEPSFIEKNIKDIFFYSSRLGLATDDTLVMSEIDDTTNFFRSTTSRSKTSDRVDIKLDSSKIGYDAINSVSIYDGKLLVNTGSTQSVLMVNTSFDLSTARLSEVSSYTLGSQTPLAVSGGLYFTVPNGGRTNVYNYFATGSSTFEAENLTKHIPTYINGTVDRMSYADNLTVMTVAEDKRTMYVQNRYSTGNQLLQNAWHKWTLPYDVEHFYFQDNNLYLLMTAVDDNTDTYTFVAKYDLTPQIVTESLENAYIGWTPYLDCYTKDKALIEDFSAFGGINDKYGTTYDTVAEAYASTAVTQVDAGVASGPFYSATSVAYYWEVDGNLNRIVWNDGTAILIGNTELTQFDLGGFRYYKGDESVDSGFFEISRAAITSQTYYNDDIVYGLKFTASVTLSEIIPRKQGADGFVVMNYAQLMLRRMRLYLGNTGVFTVSIDFKDRQDYTVTYTGEPLGRILLGRNSVSDINFKFPINGKSDNVTITISTDSSAPFSLLSSEWQGKLTVRGRNI